MRNILPKSGTFLLGHTVYICIYTYTYTHIHRNFMNNFIKSIKNVDEFTASKELI
jgi:hypothetical protein